MAMIIKLVSIGALLFFSVSITATEYYVAPNGGSGPGTKNEPWSLDYANEQLMPGDKAILRGGTYTNERIAPARSGTSESNRIVYQAYPNETPKFRPTSSVTILILIKDRSYITVDGIDADGGGIYRDSKYGNWAVYENTTHTIIKNSRLVRSKGYSAFDFIKNSTFNKILNNYVEYNGVWNVEPWKGHPEDSGSMMWIRSSNERNLIQGNTFKKSGHDMGLIEGNYNIIKDNYYDNFWEVYDGATFTFKVGYITKGDKVGNRTIEVRNSLGNVIENNIFANIPESVDNSGVGVMKVTGTYQIVRKNILMNQTGQGEGIASSLGSSSLIAANNKIFNNTIYNIGGPGWYVNAYNTSEYKPSDNTFKNNIIYKARQRPESDQHDSEISFSNGIGTDSSAFRNNEISYNCFASDSSASNQQIYSGVERMSSLSSYEEKHPDIFFKNIQRAPEFVITNPVNREDFALSDSSPCKDQAGDLTTTKSNGSGTKVSVVDAGYFTDGYGLIEGDFISVGSDKVQVKSVNMSTHELTIDRSISWSSGESVNLAVLDNKPDIGAVEFEGVQEVESPPSSPWNIEAAIVK